jgi:hypothetical protein
LTGSNGATAQEHLIARGEQGAGDNTGVLIVNLTAGLALMAGAIVPFGNAQGDRRGTLTTVVHGVSQAGVLPSPTTKGPLHREEEVCLFIA